MARDLTRLAQMGALEPTYRRDADARALLALLADETAIPLLIGDHGVGKTRIIERAATSAALDPALTESWGTASFLMVHADYDLRHASLSLGVEAVRHVFMKLLEPWRRPGPVVICFPRLHPKDLDFQQALRRKGILVVVEGRADVTQAFFNESYTARSAFHLVPVAESTVEETRELLTNLIEDKQWPVEPSAVEAMLSISGRFFPSEYHPAKAFRVLERVVARQKSRHGDEPLTGTQTFSHYASMAHLPIEIVSDGVTVDEAHVIDKLREDVIGQEDAVRRVARIVLRLKAGTADPDRPLAALLFAGPTGVGKTQLARALARMLSGTSGDETLVRVNVAEVLNGYENRDVLYGERGHRDLAKRRGLLSSTLRGRPTAVLLFDELHRGEGNVHELLFQLFDEGTFVDGVGDRVSLQNVVIIATTSVGASVFHGTPPGFHGESAVAERLRDMEGQIVEYYGVEFLNRLDAVCLFRPLSNAELRSLVELRVRRALGRIGVVRRGIDVALDQEAVALVAERGASGRFGARHLERAVEELVIDPVTRAIVAGSLARGDGATLRAARGGGLELVPRVGVEERVAPTTPETLCSGIT